MDKHLTEDNTQIIFGPPGTGKTTKLLEIMEASLLARIPPEGIGYLAFTRKAAHEARVRALRKFDITSDRLPWFRTIHSLCFRQLGLKKSDLIQRFDMEAICISLNMRWTPKCPMSPWEGGNAERYLNIYSVMQSSGRSFEEVWDSLRVTFRTAYPHEAQQFIAQVEKYKKEFGKLDYSDLLKRFVEVGECPPIQTLIVDEAQDLSALQWKVVDKLAATARKVHIAGDDDQAIFNWAGAEPDSLVKLSKIASVEVLPKSYRVPAAIQKLANSVIGRVSNRQPKEWAAREQEGEIVYLGDFRRIDMAQGTWLLLARNKQFLKEYADHCVRSSLLYESKEHPSVIRTEAILAVNAWNRLRKKDFITAEEAAQIYALMSSNIGYQHGFKAGVERLDPDLELTWLDLKLNYGLLAEKTLQWYSVLTRLTDVEKTWLTVNCADQVMETPRIKIATIHGSKGGEADNVVIRTDLSQATSLSLKLAPDSEHRVWYVALTRAKSRVFIVRGSSAVTYPLN